MYKKSELLIAEAIVAFLLIMSILFIMDGLPEWFYIVTRYLIGIVGIIFYGHAFKEISRKLEKYESENPSENWEDEDEE